MSTPRAAIDDMLDALQQRLPALLKANLDPGDFWCEFAGHADVIEDAASAQDCEHVCARLNAMLAEHGLAQEQG